MFDPIEGLSPMTMGDVDNRVTVSIIWEHGSAEYRLQPQQQLVANIIRYIEDHLWSQEKRNET